MDLSMPTSGLRFSFWFSVYLHPALHCTHTIDLLVRIYCGFFGRFTPRTLAVRGRSNILGLVPTVINSGRLFEARPVPFSGFTTLSFHCHVVWPSSLN